MSLDFARDLRAARAALREAETEAEVERWTNHICGAVEAALGC